MLTILGHAHPTPTRSLVFAGFYFLVGSIILVYSIRSRWQNKWSGGTPASLITHIVMILAFFTWGTCSLADARGWTFFQEHSLILHLGSIAAMGLCFGLDKLREYRSRLRG